MPRKKPAKRTKAHKLGSSHLILAAAKLQESGLSLEAAELMGIEVLTVEQTQRLGFEPRPALKLNYFTPQGKPMVDWPKHKPFFRIRYLGPEPSSFGERAEKPQRYTQPANTVCCAYFPRWDKINWPVAVADTATPILITEGELKAACACYFGLTTIGVGGVYNWRSQGRGVDILPELEAINWVGRNVYLCFDSDITTNSMVCRGLAELAEELVKRGAYVHMAILPDLAAEDQKKTGLDDFLVNASEGGLQRLEGILHVAQPLGLTKVLFDFSKRYVFIRQPGMVLEQKTLAKISPSSFAEAIEATKSYSENVLKPDGSISYKSVGAAGAWLTWPMRNEARCLTYLPGKALMEDGQYNVWPGWGLEPKKGNVKPFLELLGHLFSGAEPAAMEWFLRWLAYPLQHPGTKLATSAIFHGTVQGTGKSLVGYTMGLIYGKNFEEIGQAALHTDFNEWAESKQFIMGDDVTGSNKREDNDKLKKLITQREMRVNTKYIPSYNIPDCVNYFFNSNHPDAFFLEDTDRRFFIHEVMVDPKDQKFYTHYAGLPGQPETSWMHPQGENGAAAVFEYLLRLPMGDFSPMAHAFRTQARERLIADVQSDLGAWVRRLKSVPDEVLKLGTMKIERDLWTNAQLLGIYDPNGNGKVSANGLGRELRRANIQQVLGGQAVHLPDSTGHYYAVRNADKWLKATHAQCVDHILKSSPANKAAAKGAKF